MIYIVAPSLRQAQLVAKDLQIEQFRFVGARVVIPTSAIGIICEPEFCEEKPLARLMERCQRVYTLSHKRNKQRQVTEVTKAAEATEATQ